MIVKLLDKDMSFIRYFDSYNELIVTEELDTGYKTLQLQLPYSEGPIYEEQKVEFDNYVYVIKEVNMESQSYYQIYCKPYFSGLLNKRIDSLTGYNMLLEDCLSNILAETGWTYAIYSNVPGSFTVNIQQKTVIETLSAIKKLFQFDYFFDTKNKVISIWNKKESKTVNFVLDSTNLRFCKCQSNTYDLVTRLIPIGKDGISITQVNGNCAWVENFDYTDEVIVGYWVQSSVKNADDLLSLAEDRIKDISRPKTSYKIQLTQIPQDIEVGDSIFIVDKIKCIQTLQRVKKKVVYYKNIENSYLEVGSLLPSFDDIYKEFREAQKIVNDDTLRNLRELNLT